MRALSVIVAIVVVILWVTGATLIAGPSSVVDMIIPSSLGLSSRIVDAIGISTFIISAAIITVYTAYLPDESAETTKPA